MNDQPIEPVHPDPTVSLPFQGKEVEHYLQERYQSEKSKSALRSVYYAARPVMPRWFQLRLRQLYAPIQARAKFPAWPIEPILVNKQNEMLREFMVALGVTRLPFINYWPGDNRSAVVFTHDVETADGVANIDRVRKLEEKYKVVSSWNFVPERYPFDKGIFQTLRDQGCEIGVHGLYHDGKLFSSRKVFEERVPRINNYLKEWGAVGFRSPATHRNADWMPMIAAEYDSSFPDTDPFEPQAGGCCSIFPFFLGNLVELPITMPQDHTLFEILGHSDIALWKQKAEWIVENRGMVLVIIHPDYMLSSKNLGLYERLLAHLSEQSSLWQALPMEVAAWWRTRSSGLKVLNGEILTHGPVSDRASTLWAELENMQIRFRNDNSLNR